MPEPSANDFDPSTFSGVARLFPLPAPALYPRVVLPLHVFEGRYLALLREALDGDGLVAMAVLRPGWEADYAGRPPIEPVACLGRVLTHHRLEDGGYNVLLAGVARIGLGEEIQPPEAFRRARAEILLEQESDSWDPNVAQLQRRLAVAFRSALPHGVPPEPLQSVFDGDTPLGLLADLAASTLPLPRRVKQAVLAEPDAASRAVQLLLAIDTGAVGKGSTGQPTGRDAPSDGYSPPFSVN